MLGRSSTPTPCCENCLSGHRGDWEVRPNPYLLYGDDGPPCAYCGSPRPASILTDAAPLMAPPRNS
ncbi:MAG: hypothetical protein WA547_04420 [Thermoplasmata archaeon]